MNSPPKFFERFRQLREELGENQEEYAKRFGVSRNYVGMIENGRDPGDTFLKLFDIIEKQWRSNQLANAIENGHSGHQAHDSHSSASTVREKAAQSYRVSSAHEASPDTPQLSPNAARRLNALAQRIGIPASDLLNVAVHSYLDTLPEAESHNGTKSRKQS